MLQRGVLFEGRDAGVPVALRRDGDAELAGQLVEVLAGVDAAGLIGCCVPCALICKVIDNIRLNMEPDFLLANETSLTEEIGINMSTISSLIRSAFLTTTAALCGAFLTATSMAGVVNTGSALAVVVARSLTSASDKPAAAQAPGLNHYLTDTVWSSSSPLSSMNAKYAVPAAPVIKSDQLLYSFIGLEPADGSVILQPVLTWGTDSCGYGGQYWHVTSYYVYNNNTQQQCGAHPIRVNSGDTIDAVIQSTNCDSHGANCSWVVIASDEQTSQTTTLHVHSDPAFSYVFGSALEVYGVDHCTYLPGDGHYAFRQIQVYDQNFRQIASPTWHNQVNTQQCNVSASYGPDFADLTFTPHDSTG